MTISLKTNMIASYSTQMYVALAGIVMLPFYLHFMGSEAYGLVAFFVMLQGWMLLLDMGLSPTLARETAQYRAGAVSAADVRRLLHILETFFAAVAVTFAIGIALGATWLTEHWLHFERLPATTVETSLMLMGPALSLRLCSGLYRGAVSGMERIVWLSGFNSAIATARYALVIPWFLWFGTSPIGFFVFQLAVAVIEVLVLRLQCHRLLHPATDTSASTTAPRSLRAVLRFSLAVGLGGTLWSFIAQVDKLVLSKLLPLADYGYFSLAVVAASGVSLAAGPITFALSPRLVHLHAGGQNAAVIDMYRRSTQLIVVLVAATGTMLICFPYAVLWAWTGKSDLAARAGVTLALYAAGNGVNAVTSMTFFLQFARGDLRLHNRGLVLMLLILLPTLLWATMRYGMAGAGGAWLAVNLLHLLLWAGIVHRRFAPRMHLSWLWRDVGQIALPTLAVGSFARLALTLPNARLPLILLLGATGCVVLFAAVTSAASLRGRIIESLVARLRR